MGANVLLPTTPAVSNRDFSRYHAYLDSIGLIYDIGEEGKKRKPLPRRPTRQDVGNNPYEIRPEFGDNFAQGDFVDGAGQQVFHRRTSDPEKFLDSEGCDIETQGRLSVLSDIDLAAGVTAPGTFEIAEGSLFTKDGTSVKRTTDLSVWTTEDPHAGEGAQTVQSLASFGDDLFAALGSNGVHKRTGSTDTWAHYKPDGAENLNVGTASLVRYLRNRLFVVGDDGRSIYEIVDGATADYTAPPRLGDRLPLGWTFTDIWEGGTFLYASAINEAARMSRIYHFALKADATAFEAKGSSTFTRNQLIRCGRGEFGRVFVGGGKRTKTGGYDPLIVQMVADTSGHLYLETKIAQGKGAGTLDLSVRAIEVDGERLLFGWSLGSGYPFGAREGLAAYYPARGAFVNSYSIESMPATPESVQDIIVYNGRTVFATSDGLYYEDATQYRSESVFISSAGDWSNFGLKVWDQFDIMFDPLPAGTSVELWYTTQSPEDNVWVSAGAAATVPGSKSKSYRLTNVESQLLAIKIVAKASSDGLSAPVVRGFTVRSSPKFSTTNWVFARRILLQAEAKKHDGAEPVTFNPRDDRDTIEAMLHSWHTLYEPSATYDVWIEDIEVTEVAEPEYETSDASEEQHKEHYTVDVVFVATRTD